ncbi:YycC family protein [Paenibacillus sp. 1001270B_150601_E10]|uniref:YycC family protein n=1 Tax=Paenibacillus sp. 1001270B_150601_E10 TaxID=2787079 RepID=UPI00189D35EB|nr:YycC family protein [Paenibacillus sp. 1001270B_150601_E10]
MKPLQISADTAVKLSQALGVPVEHLMHMPQHILLAKLAELAKQGSADEAADTAASKSEQPAKTEATDGEA